MRHIFWLRNDFYPDVFGNELVYMTSGTYNLVNWLYQHRSSIWLNLLFSHVLLKRMFWLRMHYGFSRVLIRTERPELFARFTFSQVRAALYSFHMSHSEYTRFFITEVWSCTTDYWIMMACEKNRGVIMIQHCTRIKTARIKKKLAVMCH